MGESYSLIDTVQITLVYFSTEFASHISKSTVLFATKLKVNKEDGPVDKLSVSPYSMS